MVGFARVRWSQFVGCWLICAGCESDDPFKDMPSTAPPEEIKLSREDVGTKPSAPEPLDPEEALQRADVGAAPTRVVDADADVDADRAAPEQEPEPEPKPDPEPADPPKTTSKPKPAAQPKAAAQSDPTPGPAPDEETLEPRTQIPADADGPEIYAKRCRNCHGVKGDGDTNLGRRHEVPSWVEPGWKRKWTLDEVKKIVRDGKSGTKMRGFATRLSPEQIDDVSIYARSLGK